MGVLANEKVFFSTSARLSRSDLGQDRLRLDQARLRNPAAQKGAAQLRVHWPLAFIFSLLHISIFLRSSPTFCGGARLRTEKSKVVRGDRLDYQCTLVDLILNVLARSGAPSLRKARKIVVNNSSSSDFVIDSNHFSTDNSVASSNIFVGPGQMENNDRTLKELATPDVLAQTYELKYGLIHLLPKFHDLAGENPYKHLKEFHVVCSTKRPQGIPKDYIKMKAFPFSLDGAAKDWLYLQPVLFNTWGDMKRMFLESHDRRVIIHLSHCILHYGWLVSLIHYPESIHYTSRDQYTTAQPHMPAQGTAYNQTLSLDSNPTALGTPKRKSPLTSDNMTNFLGKDAKWKVQPCTHSQNYIDFDSSKLGVIKLWGAKIVLHIQVVGNYQVVDGWDGVPLPCINDPLPGS
ncbi:hypothetical protein CR513_18943, partial [Mucuna pruriens]